MANQEHVGRLKAGVEKWNEWRVKNKGDLPDLRGAHLRGANLHGVNFTGTHLQGVDLGQANLCEANLEGAHLSRARLSDTNLRRASLKDAILKEANLCGANLCEAKLEGAHFQMANLTSANLQGANLTRAGLRWANLTSANLQVANLHGANLYDADFREVSLRGADLHEARLGGTVFFDTDLKDVLNLESCKHATSSTIDHLTIKKSGMLPTIFLHGCGLPDSLIEYYPSLLNQSISFYSCFISYSHDDKIFARRLHDQLQGRGIRCWLDEHQILAGDDIYAEVDKGLKLWDKVLLCASKASLTSEWVAREIDHALEREMILTKKRKKPVLSIIPLNVDGHLFEWGHPHAPALRKRLASDFVGWETDNSKFEAAFEGIVQALQANDTARETPPESKL